MMKKVLILMFTMLPLWNLMGQNPGLVSGPYDWIGLSGFPTAPYLIQAGAENFYWIGASYQGYSVEHPLLNDQVISDYSNVYFIKYDKDGNPQASAVIRGDYVLPSAFSFEGDITLVGISSSEIMANGNIIPMNKANRLEYIAKYNDLCQFERIVPVWDLEPSQYPNSIAMMDPESGVLYLAGRSSQPFNLVNHGIIGMEWSDYLYVLRYDRNLALTGVFTAGFDEENAEYGYYNRLKLITDGNGGVILTGTWQGDRTPVIGGDRLTSTLMKSEGVFAFKLDKEFKKEWVLEGDLQGFDYDGFSGISEGMALQNGDVVMVGGSSTGHFSLGEVKIDYPNGAGYSNMFAFRISPEGKLRWSRPLQNMDEAYDMKKKGADSEEFSTSFEWDAVQWRDQVLYLAGKMIGDQFEVAGRTLPNKLGQAAFVAAIDIGSGEEKWGYALSSSSMELLGFDIDGSGNVALMGKTSGVQEYEGFGSYSLDASALVFHLGIHQTGEPLWLNNAYLESLGFNFYGTDLEVLKNGEVFSSLFKTVSDPLIIGGASLSSPYDYSNILVGLTPANSIGGKIYDKGGTLVFPGIVKAYKITETGAFPNVQTVNIDDSGEYLFNELYPGKYAFLAIPELENYPDGMPTYAGGAITWRNAQSYDVAADTRATFLDINLSEVAKLTAQDGSGNLSGNVSYSDAFLFKGTQARPAKKTAVILIKKASSKGTLEDDVVAYLDTDEEGNFVFDNVPDGEYNLIIDLPGLPMNGNYDIEVLDNTVVSGLDFVVENSGIYLPGTVGVEVLEMESFNIYPNPGNGVLHMKLHDRGDYHVRVFNSAGIMVEYINYFSASGQVDLDLSELQSGMYLIKIQGKEGVETLKYVKR